MADDARDEAKETTGAVTGDEKKEAEDQTQRKHAVREAAPQEQETRQEEQSESEQTKED